MGRSTSFPQGFDPLPVSPHYTTGFFRRPVRSSPTPRAYGRRSESPVRRPSTFNTPARSGSGRGTTTAESRAAPARGVPPGGSRAHSGAPYGASEPRTGRRQFRPDDDRSRSGYTSHSVTRRAIGITGRYRVDTPGRRSASYVGHPRGTDAARRDVDPVHVSTADAITTPRTCRAGTGRSRGPSSSPGWRRRRRRRRPPRVRSPRPARTAPRTARPPRCRTPSGPLWG